MQSATCVVLSGLVSVFFLHLIVGGGNPPAEQFNTMLYPAVVCTQRGGTMVKYGAFTFAVRESVLVGGVWGTRAWLIMLAHLGQVLQLDWIFVLLSA